MARFQNFLAEYEGIDASYSNDDDEMTETEQLLADIDINVETEDCEQFFTKFGKIDRAQIISVLNDQSVFYTVTKIDIFDESTEDSAFSYDDRYSAATFQGIMPDSGAAGVLTAGES